MPRYLIELAILALVLIGVEFTFFVGIHRFRRSFQWLLTESDFEPQIDKEQAARFFDHGFDADLGWTRKPGTRKVEEVKTVGEYRPNSKTVSYSIDANGSRTNLGHENLPVEIVSVGDSFAFARHVEDHETWQWYLSEKTKTNVVNWGVGNYGMDQALRRYLRIADRHTPKTVIMLVVPETLARMVNVWKHYLEYGNLLGFKGRYLFVDEKLTWYPCPVKTLNELINYRKNLKAIQAVDDAFHEKFSKDVLRFPYSISILKNYRRNLKLFAALVVGKVVGRPDWVNVPWEIVLESNFRYSERVFTDASKRALFIAVAKEFAREVRARGAEPVLVMVPYLHELSSDQLHCQSVLNDLERSLSVLNLFDRFKKESDQTRLYVSDFTAAHLSAHGNQVLAETIHSFLKEMKKV